MEDTLQLKHLAPYLPYKLKMLHYDKQKVLNSGQGSSVNWVGIIHAIRHQDKTKLLLHPLSKLTDPIEHNGDKVDVLHELGLFQESVSGNSIVDFRTGNKIPYDCLEYGRIEILLQYHFDVFGLIEKGLALEKPIKE